jgi:hypothetical protein
MPTQVPVTRERSPRPSLWVICLHALLAAAIIGAIAVTVIWAYT